MRTLTQHPTTARQPRSAMSPTAGRTRLGHSCTANSIAHLPRMIGNQALQRLLGSQVAPAGGGETGTKTGIGISGAGPLGQGEMPVGPVAAPRRGDTRAMPHDFIAGASPGPWWDLRGNPLYWPGRGKPPIFVPTIEHMRSESWHH